jgi:hypothetical protein
MAIDWASGESPRGNETLRASSSTTSNSAVSVLFLVGLVAIIAIASVHLTTWAWTQPVSFDGAMNLEVARSLAEGHGYRRMYGDHTGFSHEIQTRAPYIVPAAGVFAAFGVGVWQAQFVNLAYLVAFAAVSFLLLRRWTSWRWGVVAAAVVLATPGIEDVGLNGYGEVPALTWWLCSLLVLYRPHDTRPVSWQRSLAAGLLIGIAIVTKTVLIIGLAATLLAFLIEHRRRNGRSLSLIAGIAALGLGVCLPLLLHEWARAVSLGGVSDWVDWFHEEWRSINMQAGTAAGFADSPAPHARVFTHFRVLAKSIGVPIGLLLSWIAGSAGLLVAALRRRGRTALSPVLLTLVFFALTYFVWWLAVTPTQKAWYRRIFDGMVVLELLGVVAGATWWMQRARGAPRVWQTAAACLMVFLQGSLVRAGLGAGRWETSAPGQLLAHALAMIKDLPSDATLYGIGWFSNPAIALYSGRRTDDLADAIPSQLDSGKPAFLLVDPVAHAAGVDRYWLQRYANEVLSKSEDLRVHRLVAGVRRDPFESVSVDSAAVKAYADFKQADYPYTFGFQDREGDGWRWASASVDLLLRYQGEDTFLIDAYLIAPTEYRTGSSVGITVWINDCRLGTVNGDRAGDMQWRMPLAMCPLHEGDIAHVRVLSDNVIDSRDDRQMSFVARGLGFVRAAQSAPGSG